MLRITPASLFPLAGIPLLLVACSQEAPPAPPARSVLTLVAAPASENSLSFAGEIRARHEVDLAFRVGGKILTRLVDTGAEVKSGQALARLDPSDLELAANAAKAQLAAAESDYATARAERERYAGLLKQKFVSQAAFDARDNALNSAEGRLTQARAQSRISGNQASYGTLSSEHAAVVTAVLADVGQVVAAGQPVLRIARPEEKEVAIAIPESRVAEFRQAAPLTVRLWANQNLSMAAELRELSPAADPTTRTYAARIRLKNPPPEVRLGMTARVFAGQGNAPGIQVPLGAVVDQGQGSMVWVVSDGKATPRKVSGVRFQEDAAIVGEGLQAGETVIVAGTTRLVAGEPVVARPLTPPGQQH